MEKEQKEKNILSFLLASKKPEFDAETVYMPIVFAVILSVIAVGISIQKSVTIPILAGVNLFSLLFCVYFKKKRSRVAWHWFLYHAISLLILGIVFMILSCELLSRNYGFVLLLIGLLIINILVMILTYILLRIYIETHSHKPAMVISGLVIIGGPLGVCLGRILKEQVSGNITIGIVIGVFSMLSVFLATCCLISSRYDRLYNHSTDGSRL